MYKTRMTINDVRNANSKLPKTIMVILYFRANRKLLLRAIKISNYKLQGDKCEIANIKRKKL